MLEMGRVGQVNLILVELSAFGQLPPLISKAELGPDSCCLARLGQKGLARLASYARYGQNRYLHAW
jgi:hypothetical protein